jgi:lipoprotein-anchoring transpeptidase ErfK/SrfK
VTGGPQNPMGARGLYLYLGGKDTQLSRDNLDENGGGNQSLKRQPVAEL